MAFPVLRRLSGSNFEHELGDPAVVLSFRGLHFVLMSVYDMDVVDSPAISVTFI
jgi:hypothetical protein